MLLRYCLNDFEMVPVSDINMYYYPCDHLCVGYVPCNYIPGTNHVSRVYSVAADLYLRLVLHVMLIRL
jgi:hypothetical protein